jgi:serine/threonine-protein kinase
MAPDDRGAAPALDEIARLNAALAGRYVVESEIGRGGMACVYRARDLRHARMVALKALRADVSTSVGVERFVAEIRYAARLGHPHILPVHDSGEAAGTVFYVMPLVAGETLRSRIQRDKRLDVDAAVGIVGEIADALAYAHREGIVHRDVKPENILLLQGHAILADFGIARAVARSADTGLTGTGIIIGTPAYMSPEQAVGDHAIDGASDIYSLGCVLYEMLAGEPPYAAPSAATAIARRLAAAPPSIHERHPELGEALSRELQRALAINPSERHPSASAFADALRIARSTVAAPATVAIAVLPFANLSADIENEYFSDGLTEELIGDLSKVRSLRVTSRTSVMHLKGTTDDVPAIARKLGVRYLLEGSVRKAASNVRIAVQLIDAQSDTSTWSGKFDGAVSDVFDLQERVSREIVRVLDINLSSVEDRRLAARRIESLSVLDCYLRARHEINRMSADAIERATRLLMDGLAMSPGNAVLETALGMAEVSRAKTAAGYDETRLAHAEARARRVIASDPELPQGEFLLGLIAFERGLLVDAVRHLHRALEIDPSYGDAVQYMTLSHFYAGSMTSTREYAQRLVVGDPLSATSWLVRAVAEWPEGRFDDAVSFSRRGIDLDPDGFMVCWIHAYSLALRGEFREAWPYCERVVSRAPDSPYAGQLVGLLHAAAGRRTEALAALARLDRMHLDHHETFHLAESYAMAGEPERALALLDDAVTKGFHPARFMATTDPLLDGLRNRAGFLRVAARAQERTAEFLRLLSFDARAVAAAALSTARKKPEP